METGNRLTAVRREGRGGTGWMKEKGSAKEHTCRSHGLRQKCGEGQREGGGRHGRRRERGGIGTFAIVSAIKMKLKIQAL